MATYQIKSCKYTGYLVIIYKFKKKKTQVNTNNNNKQSKSIKLFFLLNY